MRRNRSGAASLGWLPNLLGLAIDLALILLLAKLACSPSKASSQRTITVDVVYMDTLVINFIGQGGPWAGPGEFYNFYWSRACVAGSPIWWEWADDEKHDNTLACWLSSNDVMFPATKNPIRGGWDIWVRRYGSGGREAPCGFIVNVSQILIAETDIDLEVYDQRFLPAQERRGMR